MNKEEYKKILRKGKWIDDLDYHEGQETGLYVCATFIVGFVVLACIIFMLIKI